MAWCCIARDSWTGTSKRRRRKKRIEKHASTEMQVVSQFFTTMVLKGAISAPISSKNSLKKIVRIRTLGKKIQIQNKRKTQFYHLIDTKWSAQSNPGGQITLWSGYLRQAS